MRAVLLIAIGSLCAAVLALLAGRAANRVAERRRRALLWSALDAEAEMPVEEPPRLLNQHRVEGLLSRRAWWTRIRQVPQPVVLRCLVTSIGRTEQAQVVRSSGSGAFDALVMRAIRHARFQPARVNGWPVQVWVEMPFTVRSRADGG